MPKMNSEDFTKDWEKFERGKNWNRRLTPDYYETVNVNWEMYNGNQWINAQGLSDEFPQPVFNIIKRAIVFFISSMTSSAITAEYATLLMRDDDYEDPDVITMNIASAALKNFFSQVKVNMLARDLLTDAAVSGDMATHMWFENDCRPYGKLFDVKGEIKLETIDGNNLYLGNPNSRDIQSQPYVMVYGRGLVEDIQKEMKKWNKQASPVAPDSQYEEQASLAGKIEIEGDRDGKVGYIITYKKKRVKDEDGEPKTIITMSKSIQDNYIYEDIKTPMTLYPVAFNNWEHQKNQYHGRALCTDIVPNQIFVNRMFAMAMYHLMMAAFPKAVYDKNMIAGWSNAVGSSIGVDRTPNENIFNVAGYLQPASMSPQITELIDMTIKYTKEMIGANDALLGDINPEQASGAAINVTARQSGVPLEGPKSNLYELFSDIGMIFSDMAGGYYGERPVVFETEQMNPETGEMGTVKQFVQFDFSKLQDMRYNVNVDVGATTYWDETASQARLDNFLAQGVLDFADYLEATPESYSIPNKQELIKKVKERASLQGQQPPIQPPI